MSSLEASLRDACEKTIGHFKKELGKMRTGRASTGMLEGISVDYYGSQVPLLQVGLINAPEARLITVQVYDTSAVEAVEKAIRNSDLGLNPSRDGSLIRISIPALTEQRRKDLIKSLSKMGEDTKIAVRNHRRDALDALKKEQKEGGVSEDEVRKGQEVIQKITDGFVARVDEVVLAKEKELMEV
jgi:ribosome recycling factor